MIEIWKEAEILLQCLSFSTLPIDKKKWLIFSMIHIYYWEKEKILQSWLKNNNNKKTMDKSVFD
jgi:hypothetical protein